MSQKFTPLAQSRASYYCKGSPVHFVQVELFRMESSGSTVVTLTFKNFSTSLLSGHEKVERTCLAISSPASSSISFRLTILYPVILYPKHISDLFSACHRRHSLKRYCFKRLSFCVFQGVYQRHGGFAFFYVDSLQNALCCHIHTLLSG